MPPKKKAASKSKNVMPKTVQDSPEFVTSNFTARRPVTNDSGSETPDNEHETFMSEKTANMKNVTVCIEKLSNNVFEKETVVVESESEYIEDEDETPNKKVLQKKVNKGKPKIKKQTLEDESKIQKRIKRATSVDNQDIKVEEKAISKSKKRLLDKDASEPSKPPTSPIMDLPKRRQRAASVDTLSKVSKVPKDTEGIEDVSQKKNKKGLKKEEQLKLSDKTTKPKKNTKKVVNEEKENSPTLEHNIDELLNNVLDKPKSKKGAKKDQIDIHKVETTVEDVTVKLDKQSNRNRGAAPKVKQVIASDKVVDKKSKHKPKSTLKDSSPEMSEDGSKDETDDSGSVPKSPDSKPKGVLKGKEIESSPNISERSDGKNDTDSSFVMSPKAKPKRVAKGKNELQEINEKDTKMPKPRGGRRAKTVDSEEENPTVINNDNNEFIETQSEKNNKPVAVKRKTKAKTGKK